jgi:hypothetical protein
MRLLNRIDKWKEIKADYWIKMGAKPAWKDWNSLI